MILFAVCMIIYRYIYATGHLIMRFMEREREREREREMFVEGILTRMSSFLKECWNQEAKVWMESGFETSRREKWTWSPWAASDWRALRPLASSLAVRITVSPDSASLFTSAKPMPLFAPVTMATVSLLHHLHAPCKG